MTTSTIALRLGGSLFAAAFALMYVLVHAEWGLEHALPKLPTITIVSAILVVPGCLGLLMARAVMRKRAMRRP